MTNANYARGEDIVNRTPLTGAQAEFAAELPRFAGEIAALLRQVAPGDDGVARDRALAGLRRQAQRAQGFRLHGLADELKILADRAASAEDAAALATAVEAAPKLVWGGDEVPALDRAVTPAPASGLRDRSVPVALPSRGDFRVRARGEADLVAWAEARSDVQIVGEDARGDLLVVDARAIGAEAAQEALRGALEPLVVVVGDRALAAASGAVGVEGLADLDGVLELAKNRRDVALVHEGSPARSARDLGLELVDELHRALVDAIDPGAAALAVPLGRDPMIHAALWSAIARIRELVSRRTEGRVRFADAGPDGALALAAELTDAIRTDPRRRSPDRAADVSLEGLRALVVDDDEVVTWFIGEQLRAAGMIVTEVYDGETARGIAERERPDVVVSDVVMPGMDGLSLSRALRRDVTLGDVPVVLLSWKEDLLRRVRELGGEADGYVRKESDGEHLLAAVREALRPRLRLADRFAKEASVHGRLDGMTSFTLARLVAERKGTARLVVRDGRHVFELDFVGGLLASCTRSGSDGSLLRGRRALASYLGVRSARFEAAPLGRAHDAETAKSIAAAVEPLVERARASVELVAEKWLSLASLEIDLDLVDSGAPALPGSLKRGLDGLRDGVAPHRLVATGVVDADGLLALLLDLARRGAIVSARDNLGTDRLREILERVRTRSLVEAPKARFSRPIAVPVPMDSLTALEAEEDAPAFAEDRTTLDVFGNEATEAVLDALEAEAVLDVPPAPATTAEAADADAQPASEAPETLDAMPTPDAPADGSTSAPVTTAEPAAVGYVGKAPVRTEAIASAENTEAPVAPASIVLGAEAVGAPSAGPSVRSAKPIAANPRAISWIGFLLALGLVALGGTVASWVAVRHLSPGRVPTVFR